MVETRGPLAGVRRAARTGSSGAHRLDRNVLNYLADGLERKGLVVRSMRAAFPEGEPLFPGSALLSRAHVQIAVRDLSAILRTWRVDVEV